MLTFDEGFLVSIMFIFDDIQSIFTLALVDACLKLVPNSDRTASGSSSHLVASGQLQTFRVESNISAGWADHSHFVVFAAALRVGMELIIRAV